MIYLLSPKDEGFLVIPIKVFGNAKKKKKINEDNEL